MKCVYPVNFHVVDGEIIKEKECQLLGKILEASNIDLGKYDISMQLLLDGRSQLSYREMQLIMSEIPDQAIRMFAQNLKEELSKSELC